MNYRTMKEVVESHFAYVRKMVGEYFLPAPAKSIDKYIDSANVLWINGAA